MALLWSRNAQLPQARVGSPGCLGMIDADSWLAFVYEFQVFQTGTYWYHAHIGGQYIGTHLLTP